MGLGRLLGTLFGNPNGSDSNGAPPNPSGTMLPGGGPVTMDPNGLGSYLTPVPNGGGVMPNDSAATPPPHGALVNALAQSNPAAPGNQPGPAVTNPVPVSVVGHRPPDTTPIPDNWKPRHESLLGNITDALFGTTIGERDKRFNMEDALSVVNKNPELAIQRMAQVDPEATMKLFSDVNSMKHYNSMQDRNSAYVRNLQLNGFGDMIGRIAQGAFYDKNGNPKPVTPEQWDAFRQQAVRIAGHQNLNPDDVDDLIPPMYTPEALASVTGLSKSAYHLAGQQDRNDQFSQMMPIRYGNMEANQTRAAASSQMAQNGAVRNGLYGEDVHNRGKQIENNIERHPAPAPFVPAMGASSHQNAGMLSRSNSNPNIWYRQFGNYQIEYQGDGHTTAVPTGRAVRLDPTTGKPTGLVDVKQLVNEHPELFHH